MALTEKQYQVVDETVRRRWNVDQWNITDCACAAAEAVLALERPSATDPAAQEDALVNDMARVFWVGYAEPGRGVSDAMKAALAVARQHFAAHPVTTQVPEGYVRLEDVRAAVDAVLLERFAMHGDPDYRKQHVDYVLSLLAPKQKTPGEPETVDALDQLAMSLQWEQLYTDDYKRRVLREAMQFVLQGGAHERTPTP